jgi:hypothetical protein
MGPQKILDHRDTTTANNRKASQTARLAIKSKVVCNNKDAIATALMPMMTVVNGRDVSNIKDACIIVEENNSFTFKVQRREVFSDIQNVKKDPSHVLIMLEATEKIVGICEICIILCRGWPQINFK